MPRKPPTAWNNFVKVHFNTTRKTNPAYKFKDALKDAAKLYKKGATAVSGVVIGKKGKGRRSTQRRR